MSIDTEFPGFAGRPADAVATATAASFYLESYDVAANYVVAARGHKVFLGQRDPRVCRFCGRSAPAVKFRSDAHAIPELAGNRTLVSLYECVECNGRFSAFETDLGNRTLLERIAGQVLGKKGVPSAETAQKKSRIGMKAASLRIEEHDGDPIATTDAGAKTLTINIPGHSYRPLGVYKALVKVALTLMAETDLAHVPEALRWLLAANLTTHQIDDGTRYTCFHSFTPGPRPVAATTALLLRRKNIDVSGPNYVFVLAFGNVSFQIIIPAPQHDQHLIGKQLTLRPVPIIGFQDQSLVRGPTRFSVEDLSSPNLAKGPSQIVYHFDSMT